MFYVIVFILIQRKLRICWEGLLVKIS